MLRCAGCTAMGLLLLAGCQRIEVRPSVYDPSGIAAVRSWYLGFTYFGGTEIETRREGGSDEATVQRRIPRHDDLQLRDEFNIRTVRNKEDADGQITLHTVYYLFAGHKSVDILITDKAGTVLARVKIVNGQTSAVIDDYQKFAHYCADVVGKILRP